MGLGEREGRCGQQGEEEIMSADPFCPRHERRSRPIEIPGLRCTCLENLIAGDVRAKVYAKINTERARQEAKFPGRTIAAPGNGPPPRGGEADDDLPF